MYTMTMYGAVYLQHVKKNAGSYSEPFIQEEALYSH